jgi:predicted nuclease of predicted toxin-antitoxin system
VRESIRFYADQHFPGPVVAGLRRRGIDIVTCQEMDKCATPDLEQLEFATSEGRVLVTFDTDFLAIHQAGTPHRGIIWCPAAKYSIGELIQVLLLVNAVMTPTEMVNHLEHV